MSLKTRTPPTIAAPATRSVTIQWVLLAYRIPREPSTPRIAVWRKLRRIGVVQLLDGLVALPYDARTKEHLEWIADEITAAGGEANLWLAHPTTKAQERTMIGQMAADVSADYGALIDDAARALDDDEPIRRRTAARLRRELKRVKQRDHFPDHHIERATEALRNLENANTDTRGVRP